MNSVHSVTMKSRRGLSLLLSICLTFAGFPATLARAQDAAVGAGGSIVLEFFKPGTTERIPEALLRPGVEVELRANAYDASGKSVPCGTPSYSAIQGVSGNQIAGFQGNIMTMGSGFGSAEVVAQCSELPGVKSPPNFVANNTLMTPAEKQAAEQAAADKAAAAEASSAAAGDAALAVVGGVAIAAAAVGLVLFLMPKKWCGSWKCPGPQCCAIMGACSANKEFSSESECRGFFSGTTFGKSCHEC